MGKAMKKSRFLNIITVTDSLGEQSLAQLQKQYYFCPVNLFKTFKMKEAERVLTSDSQPTDSKSYGEREYEEVKESKLADLYNKVKFHLEEERVYLNPELSLAKFSLIVGTKTLHS